MKPSQIAESLITCIEADQPVFVHGSMGIGKSQVVSQVAERLRMNLVDVRALLLDPVDMRGIPHLNGDGRTKWAPPVFLPDKKDGPTIIFLDELNAAPPLVQASCYQLILDRKLGEYTMPPDCRIIAAGNKETDRAVVHRMPAPLRNRFTHLDFEVDLEDWRRWGNTHDIDPFILGFVKFRPELLFKFDPDKNAFPTPRAWAYVDKLLKVKPSPEVEFGLIAGTVGEGAATEFMAHIKMYRALPSIDVILMSPDKAPVPKESEPSICYAVSSALARVAKKSNLDRVVTYLRRMQPEFSVLTMRDATVRDPDLATHPSFAQDWALAHSDYLS